MVNYKTIYKCCKCGATSYQRMLERAENGALLPTGAYRCSGCRNVFQTLKAWWEPRRKLDFQSSSYASSSFGGSA